VKRRRREKAEKIDPETRELAQHMSKSKRKKLAQIAEKKVILSHLSVKRTLCTRLHSMPVPSL